MKRGLFILGVSVSIVLLAGCTTTTRELDDSEKIGFRQSGTVSEEEMKDAVVNTMNKLLANKLFLNFQKEYVEKNKRLPIIMVTTPKNDTGDPELNMAFVEDIITEELMNSGLAKVTLAMGADRVASVAGSRALEDDDNFDQKTVAKKGALKAASLILRSKVTQNDTRAGNGGFDADSVTARLFTIDLIDVEEGTSVGRFTTRLRFVKEHKTFGF